MDAILDTEHVFIIMHHAAIVFLLNAFFSGLTFCEFLSLSNGYIIRYKDIMKQLTLQLSQQLTLHNTMV